MEMQKQKVKALQWHPAFFAGIQIELEAESENLIFENEHQLGTKPKEIDVLIIKKESGKPIHKNIGRIFRTYNIIEYKSPDDYLSVDDFYKVYGYVCFYKEDAKRIDGIKVEEITISFVCYDFPCKLIYHLKEVRGFSIQKIEDGIYYIFGDQIPMQLILTNELSGEENLWLHSLTNKLEEKDTAKLLLKEYGKHKESNLHKSVMNIIVTANKEKFEEVRDMCEALEELMKEELEEREMKGELRGEIRGEEKVNTLIIKLADASRTDDIIRAATDREFQKKLFEEFGI